MTNQEKKNLMASVIYASHDMLGFQTRSERVQDIALALEQIGVTYCKAFEFADVIANVIENHPIPRQGLIRDVNRALEAYVAVDMHKDNKEKGVA